MVIQSCYLRDHAEDAHFVHAGTNVIGVADGVGGYRKKGVDASAFARGLMCNAFSEVVAVAPGAHVCPRTLLDRAYRKTVASRTPAASTAVILSLSGRTLRWAYAAVGEVPGKEGDVVVVGTDGLFDNVSDDELERIVAMGAAMGFSPKNMADVIAGVAYEAARCSYRDTPYSLLERKERGTFSTGGKQDDITLSITKDY
ncbi:hypothetical protein EJB05_20648, partial [Eragrostis curvula]